MRERKSMSTSISGSRRLETGGAAVVGGSSGARAARWCTWAIVPLVVVTSVSGLLGQDVYQDGAWAEAAFRGGDLVSLTLTAPALMIGMRLARKGSVIGGLLWAGALAYNIYNYGYYVFGARFNDLFLGHILILTLSGWSLVFLLPSVRAGLPSAVRRGRSPRWEATGLGLVALILGGLWAGAILREAFTGKLA